MESQKIKNLLNHKDEKYQTKKCILLMIERMDNMMKKMIKE